MKLKLHEESDVKDLIGIFYDQTYSNCSFIDEFYEGIHFRSKSTFVNIWYDEGPDSHECKGDPLQVHFYGLFLKFKSNYYLIGFRSFDLMMTLIFLSILFFIFYDIIIAVFWFAILLFCVFSHRKHFVILNDFIIKCYNKLKNKSY